MLTDISQELKKLMQFPIYLAKNRHGLSLSQYNGKTSNGINPIFL